MAKIISYGSARTYPAEYIHTEEADLEIGELVLVAEGAVSKAQDETPNYIVIGKTVDGIVPVAAVLGDMVIESDEDITGYAKIGEKKYRREEI